MAANHRVRTPDDVGWSVTVGRPSLRGTEGDLAVRVKRSGGGFGPLLLLAGIAMLFLLAPVLVQSGRWWVLTLLPVLGVAGWLTMAGYPVELRRDGSPDPRYRTVVAGRRQAQRVAAELADEIARTPDADLTA